MLKHGKLVLSLVLGIGLGIGLVGCQPASDGGPDAGAPKAGESDNTTTTGAAENTSPEGGEYTLVNLKVPNMT
jgi:hypothetical protein